MLSLDITATLAKTITPHHGISDQEMGHLKTTAKKYIEAFLREREEGEHAWSMDPYNKDTVEHCKQVAQRLHDEKIETIVWLGIGGSALGPRVLQEIYESPDTVEFIILDTIDPASIQLITEQIDWRNAAIVVASKSGGTLETISLFFYCYDLLQQEIQERATQRIIGITDPDNGVLHNFCKEHCCDMLPIPPDVGGRYSIFSPIGLLPLALLEADIDAFVRGAKEMDTACQVPVLEQNPAALLAATQYLLDAKLDYPIRVIMPYSERLKSVGNWNQQLIAESLGKNDVRNPIPMAATGTQDQHSLLQQWMDGPRSSWHLFIREEVKPDVRVPRNLENSFKYIAGKSFGELLDACYEGTSKALTSDNRPHATITLPQLDAYHLGQLFFLLMAEVALLGKFYRIDPYGQPGVEAGKTITKEILSGNA